MRNPSQLGAGYGKTGNVTVPITAGGISLVVAPKKYNRRGVQVDNTDATNPIYITYGDTVPTAAVGYKLAAGQTRFFPTRTSLQAISVGGSVTASYITFDDD